MNFLHQKSTKEDIKMNTGVVGGRSARAPFFAHVWFWVSFPRSSHRRRRSIAVAWVAALCFLSPCVCLLLPLLSFRRLSLSSSVPNLGGCWAYLLVAAARVVVVCTDCRGGIMCVVPLLMLRW